MKRFFYRVYQKIMYIGMFFMPWRKPQIISGEGSFADISSLIKNNGGKKPLIVTDKPAMERGTLKPLVDSLEKQGVDFEIFDDVLPNPTIDMIERGLDLFKSKNCDCLVAIGGGSVIDCAKVIGARSVRPNKPVSKMRGLLKIRKKLPMFIAVPTTAGTGSEVTLAAVITDSETHEKYPINDFSLIPHYAVLDPLLTVGLPPFLTVTTGMDALTHAVEAYTSRRAQPLTDDVSLSAVKRIFKFLVRAYNDGSDIQARTEMSIAAFEAGIAINNASVTLVHGMSRPIGALFHIPHGLSNAMLLPECIKFAVDAAYDKFAELARVIGVAQAGTKDTEAADSFVEALRDICRKCEIPTLGEYGIDKKAFYESMDKMADDALLSGSPANTIKEVSKADILKIYEKLWQ